MSIDITFIAQERYQEFLRPLLTAFGLPFDPERAVRLHSLKEIMHRISAVDAGQIVGSAGGFRFTMTTPGGSTPVAGLTMVGVLPTHRRRGILSRMMRVHIDDAREKGLPITALWASEGQIYGRYGYGVASFSSSISIERERAAIFTRPASRGSTFRLLEHAEALATFSEIWERVRLGTPGMLSRSSEWWEARRLAEYDKGLSPLQRVALEIDGKPEGYALYRMAGKIGNPGIAETDLMVIEAIATSPRATADLWRYLCDIDLVNRIEARLLPPNHPLMYLVTEPRRLRMVVGDGLWLRLIDVEAGLSTRFFPARDALTFALEDAFCPWNTGVYTIADGRASRSKASPELKLDASALGSLFLGGVGARHLADAGHIEELREGAVLRADMLFRSARDPWCPEIF